MQEIRVQNINSYNRDGRGRKQTVVRPFKRTGVETDEQGEAERPFAAVFDTWATKIAAAFEEEVSFSFDQEDGQIIVKVLGQKTGKIISQTPLSEIVERPKNTRGLLVNQVI